MKNLNFGQAIEALKKGKKVSREGWNGKDMFLYLVPGSTFSVNRPPLLGIYEEGTEINYRPHIDLKTADGSVATWSPSGSDALAEDWIVLDNEEQTSITDEERIGKPLSELFVILEDLAKSQKTLYGNNSESVKLTNVAIEELIEAKNAIKIAFKLQ